MGRKRKNKFDATEPFSYDEVPSDFSPVTKEDVDEIRQDCMELIDKEFGGSGSPTALRSMLGSVSGKFDELFSNLEGAYNARRANLDKAFQEAIEEAEEDLLELEKDFLEHQELYRKYNRVHRELIGEDLPQNLCIKEQQVKDLRTQIETLKKRSQHHE